MGLDRVEALAQQGEPALEMTNVQDSRRRTCARQKDGHIDYVNDKIGVPELIMAAAVVCGIIFLIVYAILY
jgi:hypothetical protein